MRTVAFAEKNEFCQKVLRKNWPDVPIFDDVHEVGAKDFNEPIDIISGGFPCQPFSCAGKQLGKEDDRHLWPEYLRIIKELRPTWVVGENVTGIINLVLDDVLFDLEREGYASRTFDIPASSVGASHHRRRVFIVAYSEKLHSNGIKHHPIQFIQREEISESGNSDWAKDVPNSKCGKREMGWHVPGAWWEWELFQGYGISLDAHLPAISGSVDGIPNYMDRLRALGNAVVPQQVYPIFKAISLSIS